MTVKSPLQVLIETPSCPLIYSLSSLCNRTLNLGVGIWPSRGKKKNFLLTRWDHAIKFYLIVFKEKKKKKGICSIQKECEWYHSCSLSHLSSSYLLGCGHNGRNESSHLGSSGNLGHGGPMAEPPPRRSLGICQHCEAKQPHDTKQPTSWH